MAQLPFRTSRRHFLTGAALAATGPVLGATVARAARAPGEGSGGAGALILDWYDLTNQAVTAAACAERSPRSRPGPRGSTIPRNDQIMTIIGPRRLCPEKGEIGPMARIAASQERSSP